MMTRLAITIAVLATGCWTSSPTTPPTTIGNSEPPHEARPVRREPQTAASCDEVSCVLDPAQRCCAHRPPPRPPPPAPPGMADALDRSMIQIGIARVKNQIQACSATSTATGVVKVSVRVAPNGSVSSASIQASPDTALGDCVVAAIKNARFEPTVNGGAFSYPFVF